MIHKDTKSSQYAIERLEKKHKKNAFTCGSEVLDHYLKMQASQDIKKHAAVTYVLTARQAEQVLGFYSLSSIGIHSQDLPDDVLKKLPRYPYLPGILLGRLAVDINYQGRGIGQMLLIDALKRSLEVSHQIGIIAVIVEAKDTAAVAFYKAFGFIGLPDNHNKLFLPLSTILQLAL